MDLKVLKNYICVAEELNITNAAKKLHISQPPLSNQLKELENEMNTTLFIRGKRHLTLTESGQLLYRRAKEILDLSDKAKTEIISINSGMSGTISLGLARGMNPDKITKLISQFLQTHPSIKFRIIDGNSDELMEKMRSGLISLAVISSPYDQLLLNGFQISKEDLSLIVNKSNPLAKSKNITIKDIKKYPLIVPRRKALVDQIYRWFRVIKSEPNIICEIDNLFEAYELVKNETGVAIFPNSASLNDKNVIIKKLSLNDSTLNYFFVWRKGHPLPSYEEAFIDFVKQ